MRNFILGCLFVILTSATLSKADLLTVKPATPKSVVVISDYYIDINPKIVSFTKQGYIVKTMVGNHSGITIVMEKY